MRSGVGEVPAQRPAARVSATETFPRPGIPKVLGRGLGDAYGKSGASFAPNAGGQYWRRWEGACRPLWERMGGPAPGDKISVRPERSQRAPPMPAMCVGMLRV